MLACRLLPLRTVLWPMHPGGMLLVQNFDQYLHPRLRLELPQWLCSRQLLLPHPPLEAAAHARCLVDPSDQSCDAAAISAPVSAIRQQQTECERTLSLLLLLWLTTGVGISTPTLMIRMPSQSRREGTSRNYTHQCCRELSLVAQQQRFRLLRWSPLELTRRPIGRYEPRIPPLLLQYLRK